MDDSKDNSSVIPDAKESPRNGIADLKTELKPKDEKKVPSLQENSEKTLTDEAGSLADLKTEAKPVSDNKNDKSTDNEADKVVDIKEKDILSDSQCESKAEASEKESSVSPIKEESASPIKEESATIKEKSISPIKEKSASPVKEESATIKEESATIKEKSISPVKEESVSPVKEESVSPSRERSVSPSIETDSPSTTQEKLTIKLKKGASKDSKAKTPKREKLLKARDEESTPGREKRDRKKVDRYEQEAKKEEVEVVGRGVPLNDIPFIKAMIAKNSPDTLKIFHRVAYGRPGAANEVKRNLYKFRGFSFTAEDKAYERKKVTLEKIVMPELKKILVIIGLERTGVKGDLVERILNFMMEPIDAGKGIPQKRKRRRSVAGGAKGVPRKRSKKEEPDSDNKSGSEEEEEEEQEAEEEEEEEEAESEEEEKVKVAAKKKVEKKAKTPKAKTPKAKTPKAKTPKAKTPKAKTPKAKAKRKREDEEEEDSDDSDEEELQEIKSKAIKKAKKVPTDTEIKTFIKELLDNADLEEVTMKKLCQQVYDNYPAIDLSHKKDFIKSTVKSILS